MRKAALIAALPLLLLSSCQEFEGWGSKEEITFGKEPYWLILTGKAKANAKSTGDYDVWFRWSEVEVYYVSQYYPFDLQEMRKDESVQEWSCPKVWFDGKKPVVPTK
jgi:hypothetical protein